MKPLVHLKILPYSYHETGLPNNYFQRPGNAGRYEKPIGHYLIVLRSLFIQKQLS